MAKPTVVTTRAALLDALGAVRAQGRTVGFVPTMGALHRGHISLVERAVAENGCAVVSVFVNPTQFNNPNDLKTYPRTPEADLDLLDETGVELVFMPSVEEMYPQPDTRQFDFGPTGQVMEGERRPGHFNGVAQVVSRLFDLVHPNRAYFGQKDFQQVAIIRMLVDMLGYNIEIVECPIVRESDGLALSSRNALLTPRARRAAPAIHHAMALAQLQMEQRTVQQTAQWVVEQINAVAPLQVEYFTLANAQTLQPIGAWSDAERVVGCIAVQAEQVRLIDNIIFK